MKCPKCKSTLKKVKVEVEGAKNKATSYQCPKCSYVEFDKSPVAKVVQELKAGESPLKIKQKIVKLSQNRLGLHLNQNIIRSLNLKAGKDVFVSVPDRKRIVQNLKR